MLTNILLPTCMPLCRAAAASAGVARDELGAVSIHGTGTPLGDPIEVGALGQALKGTSGNGGTVLMLSSKACFGHTEGTAGLSGEQQGAVIASCVSCRAKPLADSVVCCTQDLSKQTIRCASNLRRPAG